MADPGIIPGNGQGAVYGCKESLITARTFERIKDLRMQPNNELTGGNGAQRNCRPGGILVRHSLTQLSVKQNTGIDPLLSVRRKLFAGIS